MEEQPHYMLKVLGSNILYFRLRIGISQEELGYGSELHRTYISGVERALRLPSVIAVYKIARALGVQPFELLIEQRDAIELWDATFET